MTMEPRPNGCPGDHLVLGRADGLAQPGAGTAVASAHRAGAFGALDATREDVQRNKVDST